MTTADNFLPSGLSNGIDNRERNESNKQVYIGENSGEGSNGSSQADGIIELVSLPDRDRVDVLIDGSLFTSYLYSDALKKPVLFPVLAAGNIPVTRGYPLSPREGESTDHPHHVGLWFNYGDVNGMDFWNNSPDIPQRDRDRYGTIRHQSINRMSSGTGEAELQVSADWMTFDNQVLIREETLYRFSVTGEYRWIERVTTLQSESGDVEMRDNKEGLLGIRVASELASPDEYPSGTGRYISSNGLTGEDVWGTRGRWVTLRGAVGREDVSITILDHPDNIGYPTYWHARGYGLFAANPLGQSALSDGEETLNFILTSGTAVTFRHRILIHAGRSMTFEELEEAWTTFSEGK